MFTKYEVCCFPTSSIEEKKMKICRFCLNACDIFEPIEESTKETINKLHLNIDLSKTVDPVMCKRCSDIITKCSEFQLRNRAQCCVYRQPLVKVEIDEKVVSMSENPKMCLLCTETVSHIALTMELKAAVKIVLLKYFPEIDFNCIRDFVICTVCFKFISTFSSFITNFLKTEKQIKDICDRNGSTTNSIVLSFLLDHKDLNANKPEEINIGNTSEASINSNTLKLEEQIMNIKQEPLSTQEMFENVATETLYKCKKCRYETKYKNCFRKHMARHRAVGKKHKLVHGTKKETIRKSRPIQRKALHKCRLCNYQSKFKRSLLRHSITEHQNNNASTKNEMHDRPIRRNTKLASNLNKQDNSYRVPKRECKDCVFQPKREHLNRKSVNKCDYCEYETKFEDSLLQHMVIHSGTSMHKCTKCGFETIHESCLRTHLSRHKSATNKRHKCPVCRYQTRFRDSLRQHMAVHKSGYEMRR